MLPWCYVRDRPDELFYTKAILQVPQLSRARQRINLAVRIVGGLIMAYASYREVALWHSADMQRLLYVDNVPRNRIMMSFIISRIVVTAGSMVVALNLNLVVARRQAYRQRQAGKRVFNPGTIAPNTTLEVATT